MRTRRPLTEDDVDDLHALIRRCENFDQRPESTPRGEILDFFDDPNVDPATDVILVNEDDALIAWGAIWFTPSDRVEQRVMLLGGVDPQHRSRGVGTEVLRWSIERARQVLSRSPLPAYIRAGVYDGHDDLRALLERHGFEPVRYFEGMLRPLSDLPSVAVVPDVEIRPFHDDSETSRQVVNEAFVDHWGFTPRDAITWQSMIDSYGMRRDLSWMAFAEGIPVATLLSWHIPEDEEVSGRLEGLIGTIGVTRPWRRRGLASALIVRAMHSYSEAGLTHAVLDVDSANPTGATRVYRSLGFETYKRGSTYQIEA